MKDENDCDPNEEDIKIQSDKLGKGDYIDIDSTENLRTVIVNTDINKEDFTRYQINIDWTL